MLDLPDVTLVCIDCHQRTLALAAIEQSLVGCKFADVLFVSDQSDATDANPAIHAMDVPDLAQPGAVSRFITRDLAAAVKTSHALFIEWDAFVVNPDGWTGDYLDYDVVAPRAKPGRGSEENNESTGIALVSRRLLERWRDSSATGSADALSTLRNAGSPLPPGMRRAPAELCDRFAFGDYAPVGTPFGFDRLFNMWMYFQPRDLDAFVAMATPAVLRSSEALSLAVNLHALGRVNEAFVLLKAIVATGPVDIAAREALDALSGRQAVVVATLGAPPAVGRNDPCPCGSGKRYKQCHGSIGNTSPMPVTPAPAQTQVGEAAALVLPRAEGEAAVWMHRARDAFRRNDPSAETLHRRVLEAEPDNAEATGYLGVMMMRTNRPQDAEPLLKRALALAPHDAEYHSNLGMFHQLQGDDPAAVTAYADAIRLDPLHAPAHNNLGLLLQESGRPEAAIEAFRKAIDALPAFADAHWNLSLALLLIGDFENGLEEQEWRLKAAQQRESWERRKRFPTWHGEPVHGKRVLILAEQGLGDIIHYIRYAVALAERGATVVAEAPRELDALLRTTRGISMVAPRDGPFPPCDYQIPVMSLPRAFKTRLDSIPAPVPYITVAPERTARWKALLGEKTKRRIGINWSGNPAQVRNKTRSLPLAALTPLLARNDIEWISLQKGPATGQIAALPPECALRDLMPQAEDFADTAALMLELDLVITVDTGVAHLAGALGVPTLTLLDSAADCRWLRDRHDSPWYPTMRLLRQKRRGDWTSVVEELKLETRGAEPLGGAVILDQPVSRSRL